MGNAVRVQSHRDKAKRLIGRAVLIGVLVAPTGVSAALAVIYDSGDTQPLAPFFAVFDEPPDRAGKPQASLAPPATPELGVADLTRLLPIRTPGLTPGPVTRQPLRLPNGATLPRPFFLIGSDPRSRDWLVTHRDRLAEIGAAGMLAEADTVDDLRTIARLAKGLPILPAPATDIARALGLQHIPVLISRRGIEQ